MRLGSQLPLTRSYCQLVRGRRAVRAPRSTAPLPWAPVSYPSDLEDLAQGSAPQASSRGHQILAPSRSPNHAIRTHRIGTDAYGRATTQANKPLRRAIEGSLLCAFTRLTLNEASAAVRRRDSRNEVSRRQGCPPTEFPSCSEPGRDTGHTSRCRNRACTVVAQRC